MGTRLRALKAEWVGLVLLLGGLNPAMAAELTIVEPAADTEVWPGGTITVRVERAPGSGIEAVAVHGFGWTGVQSGPDPLVFEVTVPAYAEAGTVYLTAYDAALGAEPAAGAVSAALPIRVQMPTMEDMTSNFRSLHFDYVGAQQWLTITTEGRRLVSKAPRLSYGGLDDAVATVDGNGLVTAVGPGRTAVSVTSPDFGGFSAQIRIPVTVAQAVRGDLTGNAVVDGEDLGVLRGAIDRKASPTTAHDARDLNGDGLIDPQDVAVMEGLCSFPGCADQPPIGPVADAGPDRTFECSGTRGTSVRLDGRGSSSPTGTPLSYRWSGPFGTAAGPTPWVKLPVGASVISLTVKEGTGGKASDTVTDTVVDTTPPRVTAALSPAGEVDWDEGRFRVVYRCSDRCDARPVAAATLNGITVQAGQLVELERNKHRKVKEAKRGKLLHLEAPAFSLEVSCTDASGNSSNTTASPAFRTHRHRHHDRGGRR